MSIDAPLSRSLTAVLSRALEPAPTVRLMTATRGAAITGADANAYTTVVIGGTAVRVPYLRGVDIGSPGDVAYLLATPDFMLMIGTVRR